MKRRATRPVQLSDAATVQGSAEFSPCGRFRYRLDRWWDDGPRVVVCMANPSTAGAERNDATVSRLIHLVRALGYPGFTVVNWLHYIATNPQDLHDWRAELGDEWAQVHAEAVGWVARACVGSAARIVAWGNLVPRVGHTQRILLTLSDHHRHRLYAFGLTKAGRPIHPAARGRHRIVAGAAPVRYHPAHGEAA